jgi:hypothetical protein
MEGESAATSADRMRAHRERARRGIRCKSLRRLAAELNKLGHQISHTVVGELLKAQKFSLQANRKTREGADNPDRDAQFGFINEAVTTAMAQNQPVISVDTKKKELVGDFKNAGRGIAVSDEEMASLNIKRADFHAEWNYTIASSNQSREAVVS